MPEKDMLTHIFEMQTQLNRRIGVDCANMTEEDQQKWLLNYCRAMSQEIAELTDSVPWKWWAKYQKFDAQNAAVELIDILHFWISACQVLGLKAEDVFRIYTHKHEVNKKRQEEGYSSKNETDCRHIQ